MPSNNDIHPAGLTLSNLFNLDRNLIFWMGGSPCSGKSTLAQALGLKYGWRWYSVDDFYPAHKERTDPNEHPTMWRIRHSSWDEIWMRPVDELVGSELAFYREEFSMILEDLSVLPGEGPVVAEGAALLPELVEPYLASRNQAVYLTPTEAFQRYQYPRRGEWVQGILNQCSQPETAFQHWMARDVAFSHYVARTARERSLPVVWVDGTKNIAENQAIVEQHFGLV